jgi:hypothetical protein
MFAVVSNLTLIFTTRTIVYEGLRSFLQLERNNAFFTKFAVFRTINYHTFNRMDVKYSAIQLSPKSHLDFLNK